MLRLRPSLTRRARAALFAAAVVALAVGPSVFHPGAELWPQAHLRTTVVDTIPCGGLSETVREQVCQAILVNGETPLDLGDAATRARFGQTACGKLESLADPLAGHIRKDALGVLFAEVSCSLCDASWPEACRARCEAK